MAVGSSRPPRPEGARDPQGRHRRRARRQGCRQARQGRAGHPPDRERVRRSASRASAAASTAGGAAVVVEGLNIAKRHTKPRQSAGRTDRRAEGPAGRHPRDRPCRSPVGKVMVVCPSCDQPTRIGTRHARRRPSRPRLPPLRRAAGGEGMMPATATSATRPRSCPALPEAVRVRATRCRCRGSRRSSSTSAWARP